MRQGGPSGRRPRGRHHGDNNGRSMGNGNGGAGGNSMGGNRPRSAASLRHQTFDSNGPDLRVRGNAWQVYEKYQSLARDAAGSGDRIAAENYQQHAEHYYRIIEAINEATAAEQLAHGITPQQTAYNQQPDMPQNYYTPDGTLMPSNAQPATDATAQPQPMPQAEVEMRNQPGNTFFAVNETEEDSNNMEPLVANR